MRYVIREGRALMKLLSGHSYCCEFKGDVTELNGLRFTQN